MQERFKTFAVILLVGATLSACTRPLGGNTESVVVADFVEEQANE